MLEYKGKSFNPPQFIIARIKRIIPLYWLLTTLSLGVYLLWPEKVNSSAKNGTDILASYFLLPTDATYLLAVGWTLSFEFYFYLIFSLGMLCSVNYRYVLPIFVLLSVSILGFIIQPESAAVVFFTNSLVLEFIFGILIFIAFQRYSFPPPILSSVLFIAGTALLLSNGFNDLPRFIHYGIPCLLIFIGLLGTESYLSTHPRLKKICHFLGDSSYSLYLSHPFTLVITAIIFSKIGLNEYGIVFILLLTLSSVLAGYLCYIICEQRLNKLINTTLKN